MIAIRNYNDTKCELNVAKRELNKLINKKEELYTKYFGTTSKLPDIEKDINSELKGQVLNTDKMTEYMIELTKTENGSKSLEEILQEQLNEVRKLEYYLKAMDCDMSQLRGIEYQLYYAIVIEPLNVNKSISKIIEEFAEEMDKHVDTIWKYNYPKIEKYIKKLKRCEKDDKKVA